VQVSSTKIIKSKEPDVGSYNPGESKDKMMKRPIIVVLGKPKGQKNSERIFFTKKMTNLKKFVPGVGSYKPNYDVINVPYLKKKL